VLAINAVMFVVELASGLLARSTALLSDSLDNLGDALTYGLSLYAVSSGARSKAKVALFKGGLILAAGLFVLGQVVYGALHPGIPVFEAMGIVSLIALAANGACLALLWKHRTEDAAHRSALPAERARQAVVPRVTKVCQRDLQGVDDATATVLGGAHRPRPGRFDDE
jgi:Co/Zn/Cd efflux system component